MNHLLRTVFFFGFARPLVGLVLGLNVRHRERLPEQGPAIVVANHNSHLDTLILMTLFDRRRLRMVRPVAAADYFLSKRWLAWFALKIIGILPISRSVDRSAGHPLAPLSEALDRGEILLLFPEGSRGEPEELDRFKSGVAHLAQRHPEVPVVPVFLHGAGKALPKGEAILVPFFCDVFLGESFTWTGERASFMRQLRTSIESLAAEGQFPAWE